MNGQENYKSDNKLINIGKKTFIAVFSLLAILIIISIVLTYVLPKGEFGTKIADGEKVPDYTVYNKLSGEKGIAVWKGILSPLLILGSADGVSLIVLSLFLLAISGAFQAMNDCNGIKVFVNRVIERFKSHRFLLLAVVSLLFMSFGSFLGLFEETLTILPIMAILAVSLGYDSFTGFLISVVACGFGFSSAITNPFTVIFASKIIGVNPLVKVWLRIIVFAVTYGILLLFIYLHTKKVVLNPQNSLTYERDSKIKSDIFSVEKVENEKKIFISYSILFAVALAFTVLCSAISAIRDYTVVALLAVFLFGGFICSIAVTGNFKTTGKSFLKGVLYALPSIAFILMASAVKYVLEEGKILPTVAHYINTAVKSHNAYTVSLVLFAIILVLEFFISSSTAKAIFVMSILSVTTIGLTPQMQVLIYTFADGYTNLLFPTSPVLLIGLSMIGVSYFKWLKKSWALFICVFAMVIGFILLSVLIKY